MYRRTQFRTQGFSIILHRYKYSSMCIVKIQLISNSRFLNMYCTDTTQSRTQGSSILLLRYKYSSIFIVQIQLISNSRFLNMYGTTQSRTQGSFNLYLSFKIQLQLTLCPLSTMMNVIKLNCNTC